MPGRQPAGISRRARASTSLVRRRRRPRGRRGPRTRPGRSGGCRSAGRPGRRASRAPAGRGPRQTRLVVDPGEELVAGDLGAQGVLGAGGEGRDGGAEGRLDPRVAGGAALPVGALAGVALERDLERGLRVEAPHHVDEVAAVLRAQLEAELAARLARGELARDRRLAAEDERSDAASPEEPSATARIVGAVTRRRGRRRPW